MPDASDAAGGASLVLADGRRVAWREYGVANGRPLLALHGTPGSSLKFRVADEPARRLGLRLVAPDRWGYGGTSPHPRPTLAAFAADMAALADHLGLGRPAVLGVSGGGPFAAATAALLPDRVPALALVAPVGPIAGEAVTMSPFHRFCFGPFARSRLAPRWIFRAFRRLLLARPRLAMAVAMSRVGAPDRRVLATGGVGQRLAVTFAEGLRHGPDGPATDMGVFGAAWDVPLGAVRASARLWLGSEDRHVPLAAARLLAARLPACTIADLPGEGHLWVALNYAQVLGWIAEQAPTAASQRTA